MYEKNFLMNLRNSPSSKTPPGYDIPDALLKGFGSPAKKMYDAAIQKPRKGPPRKRNPQNQKKVNDCHEDQFEIEI